MKEGGTAFGGKTAVPVRVLFLAWGYSIHAHRRIRLFAEDPAFEVAVVSPHAYRIPNAETVLLSDEHARKEISDRLYRRQDYGSAKERHGILWANMLRVFNKVRWNHCVAKALYGIRVKDRSVRKAVLHSSEILLQVEIAIEDLRILSAAAARFRPDVVFLQTLLYPSFLAYYLQGNVPIITTIWNGDILWWAQWSGAERLLKKQLVAHGVRTSSVITVNSRSAREECLGYGVSPEKVRLIRYPGVDRERFRPMPRSEARRALDISAGKVVLCPRGIGGYLNSDVIVEAAPAILSRNPNTLFLFLSGVGTEEDRRGHRKRAMDLGVGNNFRWEEHVPWESMPVYYNASDVMVSISSQDSLPNCMLEAMACGIPVVMGDIPSIREWVTDGGNGFLVPPRDPAFLATAVAKALGTTGKALDALTRKGMEQVERDADGETNARRIKDLVRQVAGAPPAGT